MTADLLAGRYRLTDRIATGGMGEVWRGRDETLGRTVAIKVMRPDTADNAGFARRFRDEARHAARLTHPNIATVYDFGEDDNRAFLVMELLEGKPLSTLIQEHGALDPALVASVLAQTAKGLEAAHRAGMVHRDVKPANIVVSAAGVAKLTDFGIARALEDVGFTRTGEVVGTAQYLSPEQATGGRATPASDLYALGCVGYEALTATRPFARDTLVATALAQVNDYADPLPDSIPSPMRETIMRSLEKDPAARPASAAQFAAGMGPAAATLVPTGEVGPAASAHTQLIDTQDQGTSVLPGAAAGAGAGAAAGYAAGAYAGDRDYDPTEQVRYDEPYSQDRYADAYPTQDYPPERYPREAYDDPAVRERAGAYPADEREERRKSGLLWPILLGLLILGAAIAFALSQLGNNQDTSPTPSTTTTTTSTTSSSTSTEPTTESTTTESSTTESSTTPSSTSTTPQSTSTTTTTTTTTTTLPPSSSTTSTPSSSSTTPSSSTSSSTTPQGAPASSGTSTLGAPAPQSSSTTTGTSG